MKFPKRNTKLYSYLEQLGVLDSGDEQEIKDAIKLYYKNYDKEMQHRKRKIEKRQFSISFSVQQINHVRQRATEYGVDLVSYLKILVIADLSHASPLEHTLTYKKILQVLQYYQNTLYEIEERDTKKWFGRNDYEELRKILSSIKDKILIKE